MEKNVKENLLSGTLNQETPANATQSANSSLKSPLKTQSHIQTGEENLDNEVDDYDIKFDKLISEYNNEKMQDGPINAQRTVPFTKSEFIYASKVGWDFGEEDLTSGLQNKNLMITMELISKPMNQNMQFETIGTEEVEASLKESTRRKSENLSGLLNTNVSRSSLGFGLSIPGLTPRGQSNASGQLEQEGEVQTAGFDGNMFKNEGKVMDPSNDSRQGVLNESTGTIDSVLFSIWDVSSNELRYKRIISYQIPHPPIDTEKTCLVSHSGDAVYWIGKQNGEGTNNSCLVVFDRFNFDFQDGGQRMQKPYKTYSLDKLKNLRNEDGGKLLSTVDLMPTLTGSSLICENKILVVKRTIFKAPKGNPDKVKQQFCWTFWDIENEVEVRQDLPPRIDGVFFQKTSKETIDHEVKLTNPRPKLEKEPKVINGITIDNEDSDGLLDSDDEQQPEPDLVDTIVHKLPKYMYVLRSSVLKNQDPNQLELSKGSIFKKSNKSIRAKNNPRADAQTFQDQKVHELFRVPFKMEQFMILNDERDMGRKLRLLKNIEVIRTKNKQQMEKEKERQARKNNKAKSTGLLGQLDRQQTALNKAQGEGKGGGEEEIGEAKIWITPAKEMKQLQFAHNNDMTLFSAIIKGKDGQQHKILNWTIDEEALEKELEDKKKEETAKPAGGLLDMIVGGIVDQGKDNQKAERLKPEEIYKPFTTFLKFNQNPVQGYFLFFIQTTQSKVSTAQCISHQEATKKKKQAKMPNIILDDMSKNMPVDVWIALGSNDDKKTKDTKKDQEEAEGSQEDGEEEMPNYSIKSIGKSASDSYMNCNIQTGIKQYLESLVDDKEVPSSRSHIAQLGSKLRTQDMQLIYPCIFSNVGDNLMIQSLTRPSLTTVLELPYDETFINFVNFMNLDQIGFKDQKKPARGQTKEDRVLDFEEERVRVAFLVRKDTIFGSKNVVKLLEVDCYDLQLSVQKEAEDQVEDMLSMVQDLDKQKSDPRQNPNKFRLFESSYSIKIPNPEAEASSESEEESDDSSKQKGKKPLNRLVTGFAESSDDGNNFDFLAKQERNDKGSFRVAVDSNSEDDASKDSEEQSSQDADEKEDSEDENDDYDDEDEDGEGEVRLDNPIKIISIQVQTPLGEDIAFVSQFNDCVVFDCVTNKKMIPIKVPGTEKGYDSIQNYKASDTKMVKVPMIQDDFLGSIFWMTQHGPRDVRILRTDTRNEMGDENFIQEVFQFNSSRIYFFLFFKEKFYVMDDKQIIRVLRKDPISHKLVQEKTLHLSKKDNKSILYSDFDQYSISESCICRDGSVFFFHESNYKGFSGERTWESENFIRQDLEYVEGPLTFKGSSSLAYVQSYVPNEKAKNSLQGPTLTGSYIVIQPPANQSSIDLIHQHKENHCNYTSYMNQEEILIRYAGRFLIFDQKGNYKQTVNFRANSIPLPELPYTECNFGNSLLDHHIYSMMRFNKMRENARLRNLNLVCMDDYMKYFVFSSDPVNSNEKKGKHFLLFKLVKINGQWAFDQQEQQILQKDWSTNSKYITSHIDIEGNFTQTMVSGVQEIEMVKQKRTGKLIPKAEQVEALTLEEEQNKEIDDFQNAEEAKEDQAPIIGYTIVSVNMWRAQKSEDIVPEKYDFKFTPESEHSKARLNLCYQMLSAAKETQKTGNLDEDTRLLMFRMTKYIAQWIRAWRVGNYLFVKYGNELRFKNFDDIKELKKQRRANPKLIKNDFVRFAERKLPLFIHANMWVKDIITTGVSDIVQIVMVDFFSKMFFVVSWNCQENQEHAIISNSYLKSQMIDSQVVHSIHGHGSCNEFNFNFFIKKGAIINLETNTPIQFNDRNNGSLIIGEDSRFEWIPREFVPGQKRVSCDHMRYLDMRFPGKIHHFLSFRDLLYWSRYQKQPQNHEISQQKISAMSPLLRRPCGHSILHLYADNQTVISSVFKAIHFTRDKMSTGNKLALPVDVLDLAVLVMSNQPIGKHRKRQTPVHVAFIKQCDATQDIMVKMVTGVKNVKVTKILGLKLVLKMVECESPVILEFFNKSYFCMDLYGNKRMLDWFGNDEIIYRSVPTAFLNQDYLQNILKENSTIEHTEQAQEKHVTVKQAIDTEQFYRYIENQDNIELKPQDIDENDERNRRQVDIKLLDFNWLFVNENSAKLISCLANTENEEIFNQEQIKVFVEYMWNNHYFIRIRWMLLYPFITLWLSFILYATIFASTKSDGMLEFGFIGKIASLVVFGKMWIKFVLLEFIQLRQSGFSYFTDFWNFIDWGYLFLCPYFVFGMLTTKHPGDDLALVSVFAVLLLYCKLFQYLRIYRRFTTFIRMVQDMIIDVRIFAAMLLIMLMMMANVVMILDKSRPDEIAIVEEYTSSVGINALLHSWLLGLGEFASDNYSEQNAVTMWIMFFIATFLVQLIFMNLLIAIMSESFARLNENQNPSTLKAFCQLMEEHEFIINYNTDFKTSRYILYMGGEENFDETTPVENKLDEVQLNLKTKLKESEVHTRKMLQVIGDHNSTSFARQYDRAENMKEIMVNRVQNSKECQKVVKDDQCEDRLEELESDIKRILDHLEDADQDDE